MINWFVVVYFYIADIFFIVGLSHAAEYRRKNRIRSLNCPSQASFLTPGFFEERRESAKGGQVIGGTFGFVFGQAVNHLQFYMLIKMNNKKITL